MASKFLSACVITLNEEKCIERCLNSLSFADEVLVIDAGSKDRTVAIAQKHGATVYHQEWNGFTAQRNFALAKAAGKWVFFLDADEAASEELGIVLKNISQQDQANHPHCYSVKRNEFFLGKELNYGPGNPSFQWRFFKKDQVRFEGDVHEFPRFDGNVGFVRNTGAHIDHWPNLNIERFLNKLNHYTSLEALDRFRQGQRTSLFHAFSTFFSTFLKNGIRYRGFLNGKEGFILVVLESFSRVVRHLKLWVLWQVYLGKMKIELGSLPTPGSSIPHRRDELEKTEWKPTA